MAFGHEGQDRPPSDRDQRKTMLTVIALGDQFIASSYDRSPLAAVTAA